VPAASRERVAYGVWLAVLAGAVAARTVELGRWPGLNGDEAWYGVNVLEFLNGGTPFLHTGVGNPLSPIHSGLLLLLSTVFEPSPGLLRVPEVILGIGAVAIANPLLGRPLGQRAAFIAALLLAVSPTAVAYSRFGWDPSGTPLLSLLAIGLALRDLPVAALVTFVFAYLVHPTNVFLAPVIAAAWAPHALDRYRRSSAQNQGRLIRLGVAGIILAIPLGAWALVRVANNPNTMLPSIGMVFERVFSPFSWLGRLGGAMQLLSGTTTATHISGALPMAAASALPAVILLSAMVFGWKAFRAKRHAMWLLGGSVVAFAGFHVVAMPSALHPGFERYALFLLVPLIVLTAMAIDAVAERSMIAGVAATTVMVAGAVVVLVGGYFVPLAARGGEGPPTFRTGAIEPKLAAFAFIDADSSGAGAVTIVAEDWWLYWSLRYFAGVNGRIYVEPAAALDIPGGVRPAGAAAPSRPSPARTYAVAFAGSAFPATLTRSSPVFTAVDPIGRPIVQVFVVETR
jgi:hypothetical protein